LRYYTDAVDAHDREDELKRTLEQWVDTLPRDYLARGRDLSLDEQRSRVAAIPVAGLIPQLRLVIDGLRRPVERSGYDMLWEAEGAIMRACELVEEASAWLGRREGVGRLAAWRRANDAALTLLEYGGAVVSDLQSAASSHGLRRPWSQKLLGQHRDVDEPVVRWLFLVFWLRGDPPGVQARVIMALRDTLPSYFAELVASCGKAPTDAQLRARLRDRAKKRIAGFAKEDRNSTTTCRETGEATAFGLEKLLALAPWAKGPVPRNVVSSDAEQVVLECGHAEATGSTPEPRGRVLCRRCSSFALEDEAGGEDLATEGAISSPPAM